MNNFNTLVKREYFPFLILFLFFLFQTTLQASINKETFYDDNGSGVISSVMDTQICAHRTATNGKTNCGSGENVGFFIRDILKRISNEGAKYTISNASFIEYTDGTAKFSAHATNNKNNQLSWDLSISFTGRTKNAPSDSPKVTNCVPNGSSDYYYYTGSTGRIVGRGKVDGGILNVRTKGQVPQVGTGANLKDRSRFGASAWYSVSIVRQPFNSQYEFNTDSDVDLHLRLSGSASECFQFDCPTLGANIGEACNDGNPNTTNDVIRANCSCAGTFDPCATNGGDRDGDGVCDNQDNCKDNFNPGQEDNDGDGIGDACDNDPCNTQGGDRDGDGVCDNQDNCKNNFNPDQADNDGDGIGNVCDDTPNGNPCANNGGDSDGDGICNNQDNCDFTFNPDQADNDGDGIGNVCDDTPNGNPCVNNGGDSDGDGICNNQDNCDFTFNPDQADNDGDGIGNVCDDTPNGNPCANNGGDSDGDGICNNQDNCDFTFNPDQADNDGDGIGNVCDDTPNGGGNGGDCNDVTATGSAGKVTIENIPSNAKVEISGPSTGWGQQIVCEGNCNAMEMVSNLIAGDYTITAQTFNPYCYNRITVTVTGGGNSNPCDGQGGDSDGDGVCDNQDNCDFTVNADQADNDGDGIGNVCDDTPNGSGNGGDCNDVTAIGSAGKVTIENIPADAKIEISGPATGWGQQLVCEGNCNTMEMVSNLTAGDYAITAQTFNPYCYSQIKVTVTGGGSSNPCADKGGDSDGDGVCDNQDNCDFTANPNQADNDGDGIGNVCDDTPNGVSSNPCDGQGGDSDGDGICDDRDNCDFTANADQADNDGDGIGNVCDDTPNGGGNGGDCNDVTAIGSAGKVTIENIPADAKIEISGPATGWGQQLVCEGNCNTMEMVSNLTPGDYAITAQTFNPYCYSQIKVTVTGGGSSNPCDGLGGDSDGDGICDNQDNCIYTANTDQADNDGDGIGNVCDDTPNGVSSNPCDGQGGDFDGDGICDDRDNCIYTANADQADNDGDGIGDVCDDTPNGNGNGACGSFAAATQLIHWDMAQCQTDYSFDEFVPTVSNSNCLNVSNTKLGTTYHERTGNHPVEASYVGKIHECSGSGENTSICFFQDVYGSTYDEVKEAYNYAEFTVSPDGCGQISKFEMRHNVFEYGDGSPTRFYLRVLKNGQVIFLDKDVLLTSANYQTDVFDFTDRPEFAVTSTSTFRFEFLPYNDNGPQPWNLFEVDDIIVYGACENSTGGGNNGNQVNCGDITINYGEGIIDMVGQSGQSYYFKINDLDNGWAQVFGCGWNCGHQQTATDLPNGKYLITISNADWSKHCDLEIEMTNSNFTGSAGSRSAPKLNFEAYQAQRTVDLQWLTNSGYKVEQFELERSVDGENFETLTQLVNKVWTEKLEYHQTTDLVPVKGINYYRVKEIYLDGSHTYTDVKQVGFFADLEKLAVYPNPVDNILNLSLKPILGKKAAIKIINAFGQVVQSHPLGIVNQDNVQIELNKTVPNGFYQLLIEVDGHKSIAKKLMVKRLY